MVLLLHLDAKPIDLCTDAFEPSDVKRLAKELAIRYDLIVSTPKAPGTRSFASKSLC
jgi:hypothetical protein